MQGEDPLLHSTLPLSLERSWNAVVRVEKLLEQMRQRPAGWRFEEVERVLTANGFELKNQRGSDRMYKHDASGVRVFLSWHGSGRVDSSYVKRAVKAIEQSQRIP